MNCALGGAGAAPRGRPQIHGGEVASSEVRRLMETTEGYDEAVWKQMAQELGLQSLHLPEAHGGQGFTFVELGIVLEEMGRVLLCAPYFSTVVLAADAIMNAGTDAQQGELLPGIAPGETIAALALTEPNGRWDAPGITMEASGKGDSYQLSGTKMFVIDGHTANTIVTVARLAGTSGEDGISFFAVDGDVRPHAHAARNDGPDRSRRARLLRCRRPPAGRARRGWAVLSKTLDQAAVGLSNEMVGGAEGAGDGGRLREGARAVRPAHRLVPGHQAQVRRHAARGRVRQVGGVLRGVGCAEDNEELPVVASLAKAYCSDAFTPPPRTSRSTAASALPGSTTPTCTSSGRRARRSCSATPRTIASCSRNASVSEENALRGDRGRHARNRGRRRHRRRAGDP